MSNHYLVISPVLSVISIVIISKVVTSKVILGIVIVYYDYGDKTSSYNLSYSFAREVLLKGKTSSKLYMALNFRFPCTCCVGTRNEVNTDFVKYLYSMIMSTEKCSLLYSM